MVVRAARFGRSCNHHNFDDSNGEAAMAILAID